jgi:hypothetical protein
MEPDVTAIAMKLLANHGLHKKTRAIAKLQTAYAYNNNRPV